jgi:hypothetical protein
MSTAKCVVILLGQRMERCCHVVRLLDRWCVVKHSFLFGVVELSAKGVTSPARGQLSLGVVALDQTHCPVGRTRPDGTLSPSPESPPSLWWDRRWPVHHKKIVFDSQCRNRFNANRFIESEGLHVRKGITVQVRAGITVQVRKGITVVLLELLEGTGVRHCHLAFWIMVSETSILDAVMEKTTSKFIYNVGTQSLLYFFRGREASKRVGDSAILLFGAK